MTYNTDERLKSYLDTDQLNRERLCLAVLALDKRFTNVNPRHPRGGRDGARDIEALFRGAEIAFGAVGFCNQACDSQQQISTLKKKFRKDLKDALEAKPDLTVFVFFTNINFTVASRDELIKHARSKGISHCEILDRERIRISLDSADGFSIRFQFLDIPLSEAEQASFFAKWGDGIHSVITSSFDQVRSLLNRMLFLQESQCNVQDLSVVIQLKRQFQSSEIGHFRLFCSLLLRKPVNKIVGLVFGSSDRVNRFVRDNIPSLSPGESEIVNGIGSGQWEIRSTDRKKRSNDDPELRYELVGKGSGAGRSNVDFLTISYRKNRYILPDQGFSMSDLDFASYDFYCNASFGDKIKAIHVYCNGYKLAELSEDEIRIDQIEDDADIPAEFDTTELKDSWCRIRPSNGATFFNFLFFDFTPKRSYLPMNVRDSLSSVSQLGPQKSNDQ